MDKSKLLARTLLNLPPEKLPTLAEELKLVESVYNDKLNRILSNPLLGEEKRLAIINKLFADSLGEETLKFVRFLTKENVLAKIGEIRHTFERLLARKLALSQVEVTTAVPLSKEAAEKLQAQLEAKMGQACVFRQKVDPEVLGGIRIRIGDRQYDNTLNGRIEELYNTLCFK